MYSCILYMCECILCVIESSVLKMEKIKYEEEKLLLSTAHYEMEVVITLIILSSL